MRVPRVALENHLKRMLMADFELPFADVVPDVDDDYGVTTENGVRVYARLLYDLEDAAWVRLWAPAAFHLRPTAKVLREVNEINQRHVGTRVLLTEDGMLMVAAEVIAGSFEEGDLRILVDRLDCAVTALGPLLQLVYGEAHRGSDEARRGAGTG